MARGDDIEVVVRYVSKTKEEVEAIMGEELARLYLKYKHLIPELQKKEVG